MIHWPKQINRKTRGYQKLCDDVWVKPSMSGPNEEKFASTTKDLTCIKCLKIILQGRRKEIDEIEKIISSLG